MTPAARRRRAARAALALAGLWLAGLGLSGCTGSTTASSLTNDGLMVDMDADSAVVTGRAAEARTAPDGRVYQYRAVCLEREAHAGNPLVMSKWMEDHAAAYELGNYHGSFKWKGHRWIIERRAKPQ